MAEQVVDIRERIEKMRTQIYEKLDVEEKDSTPKINNSNVSKLTSHSQTRLEERKNTEKVAEEKKHLIDKKASSIKNLDINNKDEFDNKIKNTNSNHLNEKKSYDKENQEIAKNIIKKPLEEDFEPGKSEYFNKKSYKDYHVENTLDENKKIFDSKSQPFPQFSLNVNNPISWKLMLLIMLMQLLTNIMLVVVLYLK